MGLTLWEHRGEDVYSLEASGSSYLITYALADLDQDGRSELIGQTSGYVKVLESVDAHSYPSQLVWSSPYLSNFAGTTAIGDTDGDGKMEIIQSVNGSGGLVIFECVGDNTDPGRPVTWQPRGLPAGSYFVRLEGLHGRTLATGKAALVH